MSQDVRTALVMAVRALEVRILSKNLKANRSAHPVIRLLWETEAENDAQAARALRDHFGIGDKEIEDAPLLAFVGRENQAPSKDE